MGLGPTTGAPVDTERRAVLGSGVLRGAPSCQLRVPRSLGQLRVPELRLSPGNPQLLWEAQPAGTAQGTCTCLCRHLVAMAVGFRGC